MGKSDATMRPELPIKLLDAFLALHKRALQFARKFELEFSRQKRRKTKSNHRRFLVNQLAFAVENTDEFDKLSLALFELVRSAEELQDPPSKDEQNRGARVLQELLKRSGYFHAILENESPEPYWEKIVERARGGGYEVIGMLLLDRFRLPESHDLPLEIAGWKIVQLSDLDVYGADVEAVEDFFPDEAIWDVVSDRWLLVRSDEV
jgi:hypothetical protein